MLDNGMMNILKDKESIHGIMVIIIRENGELGLVKERGSLLGQMDINTKGNGEKIRNMVKVFIQGYKANMKAIFKMINKKDLGVTIGITEIYIMENGRMIKEGDMELIYIEMEIIMKVSSKMKNFMVLAFTIGQMAAAIRDNGEMDKEMGKGCTLIKQRKNCI